MHYGKRFEPTTTTTTMCVTEIIFKTHNYILTSNTDNSHYWLICYHGAIRAPDPTFVTDITTRAKRQEVNQA